ncbi:MULTISPECIES: radical SAM protein [Aneurinibacillus]|uniref:Pyruvate-formate lyase-activating enzyme n=1 Tax=Aneurinibacillus thermoaerophilus TaxID=143495 RepID=A0A1G8DUB1_ANETH|nr:MULTISPECIES: radical SAM protein [Aneurinibacillus]AMA71615.1 radical SAM protein [Aneurinibacillus sp. XH2]MED0676819.1 radical SAM protein [Aneurinibacillus thermoaerophilus]MED0681148.1 radical SAM protein [Aneurinibacillus thermoaerophilus]MED0735703.1 radical SAM protein [Aneurinibacillus thermoaerophilus]MED0757596.1 radical SAM protein [Aneurinibacillus thermoaerophilus]
MYLVYADEQGQVYDHPELYGLGRSGDLLIEILEEELIPLPEGATLVSLPNCHPVGMDPETGEMVRLTEYQAVGALMPQGFTRLMLPGYVKVDKNEKLPLFGYTAVVWHNGGFYVAAEQSDDPYKWNPLNFPEDEKERLVKSVLKQYPENRVFHHLSNCTLGYGCLTASNTFFNRWEAGLPVSYSCNAGCYGCISEQPEDSGFPAPQTRMNFKPTVDELVEVMLHHLKTPESIISFGQGCEGEPSTQAAIITQAMRRVRAQTKLGFVNINTNAGLTDHIKAIVDAGLDLMRISTISAIDEHYNAYYRPRAYTLENVAKSARYASEKGVYTSINYLVFPGVFDREEEMEAMIDFIRKNGIRLIQMRNLNIDPDSYLAMIPPAKGQVFGMKQALEIYRQELPDVVIGSYTHVPPLEFQERRRQTLNV